MTARTVRHYRHLLRRWIAIRKPWRWPLYPSGGSSHRRLPHRVPAQRVRHRRHITAISPLLKEVGGRVRPVAADQPFEFFVGHVAFPHAVGPHLGVEELGAGSGAGPEQQVHQGTESACVADPLTWVHVFVANRYMWPLG